MNRRRWLSAAAALGIALCGAAPAVADHAFLGPQLAGWAHDVDGSPGSELAVVRQATRHLRQVETAIASGYVQFHGCVHEPLAGSMGIHFVNGKLAADTVIDERHPEALMYDARDGAHLRLLGAEYLVFQAEWDAEHAAPPALFGQTFSVVPANNRYGVPAFYELHVWAWQSNPAGNFADWNPTVLCTATDGHHRPA